MSINATSASAAGQPPHGNCLNQDGALRLARKIEGFWAAKGAAVEVTVEREGSGRDGTWIIRSDLINGRPRTSVPTHLEAQP